MQEKQSPDYLYFNRPQNIKQSLSKLTCPQKKQAYFICFQKNCKIPALMCVQKTCSCRKTHINCPSFQIQKIIQSINKRHLQTPQNIKKFYKRLKQQIQQMIQRLSIIKQQIELQQVYFGLQKQQIYFVKYAQEGQYDKIQGQSIQQISHWFDKPSNYILKSQYQLKQQSLYLKQKFDQIINYIQKQYSKISNDQNDKNCLGSIFVLNKNEEGDNNHKSNIIKKKSQENILCKWLSQTLNVNTHNLKLRKIYTASQNNFSASKFNNKCMDVQNTLTIIQTEYGKIIGGFNPNTWKGGFGRDYQDETNKCFIFSLTQKEKYPCINLKKAYHSNQNYGPIFGTFGYDILIHDQANIKKQNWSNFPISYNRIQENLKKGGQTLKRFIGTQETKFDIKEYEVYQVIINKV